MGRSIGVSSSGESSNVSVPAEVNDDLNSNWCPVTGNHQNHFTYLPNNMLSVQLQTKSEPLDYYKLFFTVDILECMVLETNENAEQYLKNNRISRTSRYRKWEPVTPEIMIKFIGLLLWMGIVKYPCVSDYWSKADRYANTVAPKVMSRNQFEL